MRFKAGGMVPGDRAADLMGGIFDVEVFFRDERHLLHAGLANQVHQLHHVTIIQIPVGLHEDHLHLAAGDRLGDFFHQVVAVHLVLVQEHPGVVLDGEDELHAAGIHDDIRLGLLRDLHVESLLEQRRHHHENDEQYQHHVDERGDVDFRLDPFTSPGSHSHGAKSPSGSQWLTALDSDSAFGSVSRPTRSKPAWLTINMTSFTSPYLSILSALT